MPLVINTIDRAVKSSFSSTAPSSPPSASRLLFPVSRLTYCISLLASLPLLPHPPPFHQNGHHQVNREISLSTEASPRLSPRISVIHPIHCVSDPSQAKPDVKCHILLIRLRKADVKLLASYCPAFFFHRSISARLARLHPFLINSCFSNSSALARLMTSTQRHTLRNAFSSRESLFGFFSLGVPLVAIRKRALSGSSFRYGGSDSIISMAMMPRDHISTLGPYSFCFTTSGAIQYGVPTMVARLFLDSVNLAQKPKSARETVSKWSLTSASTTY